MKRLAQVLMLTVALFALTSAPPATVHHTEGLGVQVVEMVLTAPVAAQELPDCATGAGQDCSCWCQVLSGNRGEMCEERHDPFPPGENWSGPYDNCETHEGDPKEDCEDEELEECYVCHSDPGFCDNGNGGSNGGGNGGDGDGGGSQSAFHSPVPSGVQTFGPGTALALGGDGVLRTRCGGWVVGVTVASRFTGRLLL